MTEEARSRHYELYKDGLERVMVATSAFDLGVDIADITEVVLFGLPTKGSELIGTVSWSRRKGPSSFMSGTICY